jgi:hypothetical protein
MDPYGGLAAVFGLMVWMEFSATIVFLGASPGTRKVPLTELPCQRKRLVAELRALVWP